MTTCVVPDAGLYTSVQGQARPGAYETHPVAASLVVKVTVILEAVRLLVTILVISGAVTSTDRRAPSAHLAARRDR